MKMNDSLKCCLRCDHFRLKSQSQGLCRKEKKATGGYFEKSITDQCKLWKDCGQNYFIRKGWIKARQQEDSIAEH
ncbi:MAG: hypothetical protein ACI8ZB_001079 [Desulforhopalus sp.]|jgi:hypothetical protein